MTFHNKLVFNKKRNKHRSLRYTSLCSKMNYYFYKNVEVVWFMIAHFWEFLIKMGERRPICCPLCSEISVIEMACRRRGDGFSGQVVGRLARRSLESSVSVRGENKESVALCVGGGLVGVCVGGELLMVATFFRQGGKEFSRWWRKDEEDIESGEVCFL